LNELSRRLEQGIPLAKAIEDSQIELPPSMKALVESGIETGHLDSLMQYSIGQSQRDIFLRLQLWMTFSYPVFVIWFAIFYCMGVLQFLVPMFTKIFDDFGTELPGLTVLMIGLSRMVNNVFSTNTPTVIFRFALFVLMLIFLFVVLSRWVRAHSSSLPLIGRIFRFAALADFCQVLALLLESGLPFPRSLQIAGKASQDGWLNRRSQSMANVMQQGTAPDDAAKQVGLPNTLVQIFHNASSEGAFVQALRGLSDVYSAQCFLNSRLITSMIGPLSMVLVAFFIGLTVIALFMPMIKLLNDLS
jgi:type II secretory pathway component PulF